MKLFNRNRRGVLILALTAITMIGAEKTPPGPVGETTGQRDARMGWWRDARFGMFIHWGIYAVPGEGEWYMTNVKMPVQEYEKFTGQFNPAKFDADKIAATAQAAGQKYLVITAKHHDGFCMFKTETTKYNVVDATPWHTDPLAALSAACAKHDVRFCCYYSIMDWHSPDQVPAKPDELHPTYNPTGFKSPESKAAYITYMKTQLKELITNYHPGLIWFDGDWMKGWTKADGADLVDCLYKLDPKLIINDRVHGGGGDYGTPEQKIPANGLASDWETCMTINGHWGFAKSDERFKTKETLLHNLIDIASKGGNYLLNVGPTPEGEIPQPEVDALKQMGDWLKVNGDAIYGTKASPFKEQLGFGRATRKGNVLFVSVFDWPKDGKITLPLKTPVTKACLMTDKTKSLPLATGDAGVVVTVPDAAPDPVASVLVLECASEPVAK